VTTGGFGKRVPVAQFRLQNRAGKGLTATKFKAKSLQDQLSALRIVNADEELMIVTNRGIIIRQSVAAISSQSRSATGVRLQRIDDDDAIAAVTIVPASDLVDEATDLLDEAEDSADSEQA
jgi:DNA gyrase subunit A